jgi:two-component system, LuxR family, response regulator FixJ
LSWIKALRRGLVSLKQCPTPRDNAGSESMEISASVGNPLVVVVDDDASVRDSLKILLELEGFAVSVYAAGADLLEATELPGCACFVIDQDLPGIKGLDLAAHLRIRQISAPVILVTGLASKTVRARAADAGIPVIEKPRLGNDLLDTICAVVEKEV